VTGGGEFTGLPDLASRAVGGAVVASDDASFAAAENLLLPHPAVRHDDFGHHGKVYDGWETRRRRSPGADSVTIRLGVPGIVAGVVVDTAFFTGNHPVAASLHGLGVEGYPTPAELAELDWRPLLPESVLVGDTANAFPVPGSPRLTHVRLTIHPDGGVARLRVHGTPVPDPRLLDRTALDLAALENGAVVTGCSNAFYGRPGQLIAPGPARSMGEGWETARRRGPGNDWVELRLAGEGRIRLAELDTSWFLHNAPGSARVTGRGPDGAEVEILPRTRLLPDTRHRFPVDGPPVTEVRLDAYPDGGLARLRLWGALTPAGRSALGHRWYDTLPAAHAAEVRAALGPTALAAALDGPT
jgi:allantoicase